METPGCNHLTDMPFSESIGIQAITLVGRVSVLCHRYKQAEKSPSSGRCPNENGITLNWKVNTLSTLDWQPTLLRSSGTKGMLLKFVMHNVSIMGQLGITHGYETVGVFYYQDIVTKEFNLVKTDWYLLELVKDLKHEDSVEFSVFHVLDEPILDPDGPTGFLPAPEVINSAYPERESIGVDDSANIEREFVGVGEKREANLEDFNLEDVEIENINLGKKSEAHVEDVGIEGGDETDVEDIHVEDINIESELSDYLISDSDLGDIPSEDGSDADEELRDFR
ncbi:hypothetical protein FXO38_17127 [Capsicum annuum]|nr:hypothetical protein FXO38_17127 [Capsicum annuum]KAF3652834.1 hypothetical protein FXO37_17312 [Capsicum annuum]